jgi:hypothetical protein
MVLEEFGEGCSKTFQAVLDKHQRFLDDSFCPSITWTELPGADLKSTLTFYHESQIQWPHVYVQINVASFLVGVGQNSSHFLSQGKTVWTLANDWSPGEFSPSRKCPTCWNIFIYLTRAATCTCAILVLAVRHLGNWRRWLKEVKKRKKQ